MILYKTSITSYLLPTSFNYQARNVGICNEIQPFQNLFELQDLYNRVEESSTPVEDGLKFVARLVGDGPGLDPDIIQDYKNKFNTLPDTVKQSIIPLIPIIIDNLNNDRDDLGAGTRFNIPNPYNKIPQKEDGDTSLPNITFDFGGNSSPSNKNPETISLGRTGPCNYLSGVSDKLSHASKPAERAGTGNLKRWDAGPEKIIQPDTSINRHIANKLPPDNHKSKIVSTLLVTNVSNNAHLVPVEVAQHEESLIINDNKSIAIVPHSTSTTVESSTTPLIASQEVAADIIGEDKNTYGDCYRVEHEFNNRFNPNDPDHRFEKVSPISPDTNPDIVGLSATELVIPNGKVVIPADPFPAYDSRAYAYAPVVDQLLNWSRLDSGETPPYPGSAGDSTNKNNETAGEVEIEAFPSNIA